MAYFWILSKNVFCILSKNVFCIPGDIPVQMEYLRELGMGRQRGGANSMLPACLLAHRRTLLGDAVSAAAGL
jgi:hypothetical protein